MREIFLGEYVKQRRLELGLTQEQLCEGICEPITISRMENGKQTPSYNRICAFLQRLEFLSEALRITVPNLDLEEINLGLYSMDETTLLNMIAHAYTDLGEIKKAIDIYRQLLKYVQKHYCDGISQYAGNLTVVAHNYSILLLKAGHYDDAIEIAKLGWKACVEYAHYQALPGVQHLLGECYFYKGNLKKCEENYRCAYYLYKTVGNDYGRLHLKEDAKKHLGADFSF